jgi:surface protein
MLPLKNKKYKMENTCDECVICYDKKSEKPEKTTCGHCFHPDCLKKWTQINNTCPYCRKRNPTFPFKFNNETLKEAVNEYLKDKRSAIRKYGDISKWDVSNVTNMERMFDSAESFNGDLSEWDVSNVTNMRRMFCNAHNFNGDLSKWNVSNVTNMYNMFGYAESFNGDLSAKEVTLEDGTTYNAWDVSNVRIMVRMFAYARSFNGDLSGKYDWYVWVCRIF